MEQISAYCWRSGLIGFCPQGQAPEGAIVIASGPEKQLRDIVDVLATHCWDNVTLKVGGIATAETDDKALDQLEWFTEQVHKRLAKSAQEASHG